MKIKKNKINYVITGGDEGVQINEGRRIAIAGSGYKIEGFEQVVKYLKKLLGDDIAIASSQENDWCKKKMDLNEWGQVNAAMQQHIEALADKNDLNYSGYLEFIDPQQLKYEIKGHMVRPRNVHVANKICFTLGGGEVKYNLSCFQISADWVHLAEEDLIKKVIEPQIEFYKLVSISKKVKLIYQTKGELGDDIAQKNRKVLKDVLKLDITKQEE